MTHCVLCSLFVALTFIVFYFKFLFMPTSDVAYTAAMHCSVVISVSERGTR